MFRFSHRYWRAQPEFPLLPSIYSTHYLLWCLASSSALSCFCTSRPSKFTQSVSLTVHELKTQAATDCSCQSVKRALCYQRASQQRTGKTVIVCTIKQPKRKHTSFSLFLCFLKGLRKKTKTDSKLSLVYDLLVLLFFFYTVLFQLVCCWFKV